MSTRTMNELLGPETYPAGTSIPPLEHLRGMEVRSSAGDRVGTVEDVYTEGRYVRYLAVATGWLGTRRHLVPVDDVRLESAAGDDLLVVPYDKETLREGPSWDPDEDVTHRREEQVYDHYGRPGYWDAVRARQTAPAPTPQIAEAAVADAIRRGEDPDGVAVKRWGL